VGDDIDRVTNLTSASSTPAGYRFPLEAIAVAVRWYLRYGLSYRDAKNCWPNAASPLITSRSTGRLDLLCLDELGYVQIDPRAAEVLFQIITEGEERASIAIAANLPFSAWGSVFPDPRLVAAIVDRVTFNAHILETGTQSYRLRTSKTDARPKRSS
jgi:hypothetical protein